MNRKYQLSLFLILLVSFLNAQFRTKDKEENLVNFDEQIYSWGYYLGVNSFTFKIHPTKDGLTDTNLFTTTASPKMGFSVGLIGKRRLNDYFDARLEPALHFTQRELRFNKVKPYIGSSIDGIPIVASDTIRNVKSTYIDIPIFLNFHGRRYYNTRPYIQAGIGWMINLQSNEKKREDNTDDIFRTTTHNFTWQAEMGVEMYFKRFKLTPSVRGIFFVNDELRPDNAGTPNLWAGSINSMNTRAVLFSLKFE